MVLSVSCIGFANAQSSSIAAQLYEKARTESLKRKTDYEKLAQFLIDGIGNERNELNPDFIFLGKCQGDLAHAYDILEQGSLADEQLWQAAYDYFKGGDAEMANKLIGKTSNRVPKAIESNRPLKALNDSTLSYNYCSILSVEPIAGDSFEILLNVGSEMGVEIGQKGGILTAFHKIYKQRGNESFGNFEIIHTTPYRSKAIATRTSSIKIDLLTGDNARIQIKMPKFDENNLLIDLAKLNIFFLSNTKLPFFYSAQYSFIAQKKYHNLMLGVMLNDIKSTAKALYNPSDSTDKLSKKLKSEQFENYNMWEAMLNSREADLKAFLRFVIAFPAKYMGRNFRLDETYATWLINKAPTSNGESDMASEAKSLFRDYKFIDRTEIESWLKDNQFYLSKATNLDSVFSAEINTAMDAHNISLAENLTEDLHQIAKLAKSNYYLNSALTNQGHIFRQKGLYDSSIAAYSRAIDLKVDSLNLFWWRGYVYEQAELFGKALKDYKRVIEGAPHLAIGYGSYSWALIQMGKFKQAKPYSLIAYKKDPSELAWVVNLGHCHLLLNELDSARMRYTKTLEALRSKKAYEEGIWSDFKFFLENGWSEDLVTTEMARVKKDWDEHYNFKAESKLAYDQGLELLQDNEYEKAAKRFTESIALEKQGRNIDHESLRTRERYAGVSTFRQGKYSEALEHYSKAWDLSRELGDLEIQEDDLEDISYIYSVKRNSIQSGIYEELQYAVSRKINELSRSNNLHILSIGIDKYEGGNYMYAENDAKEIGRVFPMMSRLVYDSISVKTITGQTATKERVKKEFDQIVRNSKSGDCFIFYFAGDASSSSLYLANDTIESWEFNRWLKSLRAKKHLLLFDSPFFDPESRIMNENLNKLTRKESNNSLIISNNGKRVELTGNRHGILTAHVLDGLNKMEADDKGHVEISAKNLEQHLYKKMKESEVPFNLSSKSVGTDFNLCYRFVQQSQRDTIAPVITLRTANVVKVMRGGKSRITNSGQTIEGRVTDENGIASLWVNGEELSFEENGLFSLDASVLAKGSLTIRAIDLSENVTTQHFEFVSNSVNQTWSSSSSQNSKNYAVLIATDEYNEWSDLNNPISDVEAIGNQLQNHYGFEVDILRNLDKQTLTDTLFHYMSREYGPKDQLLLFFAGHGINDPNLAGQIVCKDSKLEDRRSLPSYIPFSFITDNFDRNNCKHVFLAMDVCFGGAYFDQNYAPKYEDVTVKQIGINSFVNRKAKYQSRQFLTSGTDEYVSDGIAGSHSPFALSFLQTLERGKSKKYLTLMDFVDRMRMLETEVNYGAFGNHHRDGEFVLLYKEDPNKKLAESKVDPTN